MSKKLIFLISLVLVLGLAVQASAEETLLASYEQSEADACDLLARVNDESSNVTEVVTWPMLQGTDACSYDPNFGPGVTVPTATDGNRVLGMSWLNETDGRVALHNEWLISTFDCVNNDKILIDVYIVGPNGVPGTIELWDDDLDWLIGHHDTPIVTDQWFTVTFDLSELKKTANRLTNHWQITTIYFKTVVTDDGKVFFDNLRLWRPFGPKPSSPSPADEADNVGRGANLGWVQGEFAASHDIYFGTDFNDVNDANNSWPVGTPDPEDPNVYKGNQDVSNCSYALQLLAADTNYYWRIDAVNEAGPDPCMWKGDIWSFTTGKLLIVDDFEFYLNTTALDAVWTTANLNNNGAELSLETDAALVRARQSMMFAYRNKKVANQYAGSEAEADATKLEIGTDWVSGDPCALVLYFYGDPCNAQEGQYIGDEYHITNDQMYVAVEDGDGNVGIVKYDQTYSYDMNDIKKTSWQEWNIDLQDPCFIDNAVDMNNVVKVYIGFGGQKTGQSAGGAGQKSGNFDTVWFDDIFLFAPRCRPEYGPAGDFDDDCMVNLADLGIMGGDWLDTAYDVNAEAPNNLRLRAYYDFNETTGYIVHDSSSNGYDANLTDELATHWDPNGYDSNGCIYFGGELAPTGGFRAKVINAVALFSTVSNEITISCWINGDEDYPNWSKLLHGRSAGGDELVTVVIRADGGVSFNDTSTGTDDSVTWYCDPSNYAGSWNHFAFVKNLNEGMGRIYHNGSMVSEYPVSNSLSGIAEFAIGGMAQDGEDWANYTGKVDEFRIYDYALSQAEVLNLAGYTIGQTFHQPLLSPANAYDADEKIDFLDYSIMANNWLEEKLWP